MSPAKRDLNFGVMRRAIGFIMGSSRILMRTKVECFQCHSQIKHGGEAWPLSSTHYHQEEDTPGKRFT